MSINIAIIITCFNRKEKTIACLSHLFEACNNYNIAHTIAPIQLSIYLTDDGCTDGTANAVRNICKGYDLHIIQGNGQCYWAGGMRLAWQAAIQKIINWDFYLLVNDDTMVYANIFEILFQTHKYSIDTFKSPGIYSGLTTDENDNSKITYGGRIFQSSAHGKSFSAACADKPTLVDKTNANVLLVPSEIVKKLGIFYEGYIHGCADYDYSLSARKAGYPALTTACVCATCEYDHLAGKAEIEKLKKMSIIQRYKYVNYPTHSDKDYLLYVKRNMPKRYFFSWMLRKIRILSPAMYATICKLRKLEDYQ